VLTAKTTNRQLNALAAWINIYCQSGDRVDRIPLVDGRPFRVTTRQFRRTLAWFIARQPGGAIAGAIHYRHLSIQMFEGYAGTSDSGFRAEVESEQALARGEHYLAAIDTHDHYDLLGPAAQEGRRRLELFGASASFAGSVVTDQRRLLRIVQRHDPAIYPGTYATCVFDPDKAMCRPRPNTATPPRPALQDCQPLDCKNVALDAQNIAALRAEISDIDLNLADRPLLNPLLLHRLRERREQIQTFIHRCTTEEQ
jgi:hypothetical protein